MGLVGAGDVVAIMLQRVVRVDICASMVSIRVSVVMGSRIENHWSSAAAIVEDGVDGWEVEAAGSVSCSVGSAAWVAIID